MDILMRKLVEIAKKKKLVHYPIPLRYLLILLKLRTLRQVCFPHYIRTFQWNIQLTVLLTACGRGQTIVASEVWRAWKMDEVDCCQSNAEEVLHSRRRASPIDEVPSGFLFG